MLRPTGGDATGPRAAIVRYVPATLATTADHPGGTMATARAHHARTHSRRRAVVAIAAISALSLAAAACAESKTDDTASSSKTSAAPAGGASLLGTPNKATGSPVKVGVISDGATQAFDNSSEFASTKAAADYWNEYRNGIAGHVIEVITCETKASPAGAGDCANQMIGAGAVAVVVGQSAVTDAIWKPLHEAKVPLTVLAASGTGPLTDPDSTFNLNNGYGTLFTLPISVAKENKAKKVAFVVIDVPQALEAFDSAAPAMLKAAGLEYDLVKVPIGTADMTPQMQQVAASGATVVQVVGNDSFCIAAFNGLKAVGYTGKITSVTYCISDATRKAVDPSVLEGMMITATSAVGATDDKGYQLYVEIMKKYAPDTPTDDGITMGAYVSMASFLTPLEKLEGEVTPASIITTIKGMDKTLMPGAGGLEYQCNGKASPENPAVCTSQVLQVELDAQGQPAKYSVGSAV